MGGKWQPGIPPKQTYFLSIFLYRCRPTMFFYTFERFFFSHTIYAFAVLTFAKCASQLRRYILTLLSTWLSLVSEFHDVEILLRSIKSSGIPALGNTYTYGIVISSSCWVHVKAIYIYMGVCVCIFIYMQ